MDTSRRSFVGTAMAGFGALSLGSTFSSIASSSPFRARWSLSSIGPLLPSNSIGLRLPQGFSARVVGVAGQKVALGNGELSDYTWHKYPDGGACYETEDGGWIYASNSEVILWGGGAGALRFNAEGEIVDAYSILKGTTMNCAGGPTPWQTWLSCEEVAVGQVFDCDIYGKRKAEPCPGLGFFKHEAVAVDPRWRRIYLTEDEKDGCFYRYTATSMRGKAYDLKNGLLELAAMDKDGYVSWIPVPNPNPQWYQTPTRHQVSQASHFTGGEGIWYHEGRVLFTTKGDNRVWEYSTETNRITVLYEKAKSKTPILSGVDNVTVTSNGDILVGEDGGDMQIVVLGNDGRIIPLVQVMGQDGSEICGPALSPRGDKLYFSSQRGEGQGITYEITGRFLQG